MVIRPETGLALGKSRVYPQAMLFASGFARPLPCGVMARRSFRSTRWGLSLSPVWSCQGAGVGPAKRPHAPQEGAFALRFVFFSSSSQLWDSALSTEPKARSSTHTNPSVVGHVRRNLSLGLVGLATLRTEECGIFDCLRNGPSALPAGALYHRCYHCQTRCLLCCAAAR